MFAAASLTEAFDDLDTRFAERVPGAKVSYNFGGSNVLRAQIELGARADVFASANDVEMQHLAQSGMLQEAPTTFARNRLVVIVPENDPATSRGWPI